MILIENTLYYILYIYRSKLEQTKYDLPAPKDNLMFNITRYN